MTFHEFHDDYRVFRNADRKNRAVQPEDFYRKFMRDPARLALDGFNQITLARRIESQKEFYKWGKPYVKVYPMMAVYLAQTKADIDCKYLKPAYPTFEIRLSLEDNEFYEGEHQLKTVLAHFTDRYVHLYLDFGWDQGQFGLYYEVEFELIEGKTISESIEAIPFLPDSQELLKMVRGEPFKKQLSRGMIRSVVSLVITVNFFLTSEHEIVAPDIIRKHYDKFIAARNAGDEDTIAELIERSAKDGHNGWTVGREISLPRSVVHFHRDSSHTSEGGWELRWGHIRSGHLRLQPFGPRELGEKKLVFIMPSVIRADLPMRPKVGYRIEDDVMP